MHFLKSNFNSVTDKNQSSPIGFDITFPGMLEYANDLGLKLPVEQTILDTMIKNKTEDIRRYVLLILGITIPVEFFYTHENIPNKYDFGKCLAQNSVQSWAQNSVQSW